MKKLLFVCGAVFFLQAAFAQFKQGKIVYERILNVHRRMTDESMKGMIPEFDSAKVQLLFSGDESIFKGVPEEQDIRNTAGNDDDRRIIKFGGADNQTYKNYGNEQIVELRELGPKKYIIEDSIQKINWKLGDGTKTILGRACKNAMTKNKEGKDVIAWYCEEITAPTGPEQFGGLPGIILELNINDAEIVFSARDISTKDFDKKLVQIPSGAKKISRKEFQKMMDDQFGPNPGGGPVIRVIREG